MVGNNCQNVPAVTPFGFREPDAAPAALEANLLAGADAPLVVRQVACSRHVCAEANTSQSVLKSSSTISLAVPKRFHRQSVFSQGPSVVSCTLATACGFSAASSASGASLPCSGWNKQRASRRGHWLPTLRGSCCVLLLAAA